MSERTVIDVIHDLQKPSRHSSVTELHRLHMEAAELLAVLNSGNKMLCERNAVLQDLIEAMIEVAKDVLENCPEDVRVRPSVARTLERLRGMYGTPALSPQQTGGAA